MSINPVLHDNELQSADVERRLYLEFRKDLIVERQTYQGRDYWVVKDPLNLKYYRFEEEEFYLLRLIDGTRTPDEIK
ncbi:MAG: hypothetical protein AAF623_20935, partial [Planctomycetota bacterium]